MGKTVKHLQGMSINPAWSIGDEPIMGRGSIYPEEDGAFVGAKLNEGKVHRS